MGPGGFLFLLIQTLPTFWAERILILIFFIYYYFFLGGGGGGLETRSPAGRLIRRLEVSFAGWILVRRLEVSFAGSIIEAGKQNQDLQFSNHPASLYTRAGGSVLVLSRRTRLPQKHYIF